MSLQKTCHSASPGKLPLPALPPLPAPVRGSWLLPPDPRLRLAGLADAMQLLMYERTGSLDRCSEQLCQQTVAHGQAGSQQIGSRGVTTLSRT